MDEFGDVDSLMGTAGPTGLQVPTLRSCTEDVSCPVVGST